LLRHDKLKDHKLRIPNFIIGGTSKAATTSLFNNLIEHPEVCGSSVRETFFFIGRYTDNPEHDLLTYSSYFSRCQPNTKIIMESTPGYLEHGRKTAKRIESLLQAPKLLFILRDPVDRLFSYFNFMKSSLLEIPSTLNFDQYIKLCLQYSEGEYDQNSSCLRKMDLRALMAGRYSFYLKEYMEVIDPSRIKVGFYEDFKEDNFRFMQDICNFLEIDSKFYNNFDFKRSNVTYSARFKSLHRFVWFFWNAFFIKHLSHRRKIKEPLVALYKKINSNQKGYGLMDQQTREWLQDFYRESKEDLKILLGHDVNIPWNW